jgi:hypothetical protein
MATLERCRPRRDTYRLLRCGWEIDRMTEYLIAVRAVIVLWTNLAVMPAEIVFDAIEGELERRGIEL